MSSCNPNSWTGITAEWQAAIRAAFAKAGFPLPAGVDAGELSGHGVTGKYLIDGETITVTVESISWADEVFGGETCAKVYATLDALIKSVKPVPPPPPPPPPPGPNAAVIEKAENNRVMGLLGDFIKANTL
jgi:hypothetical protein